MLVEFRVKNFRSFKDEQVLSMVAAPGDDSLPENVHRGQVNLLKSAAIYGPNASGKSNLIRAMRVMQNIISDSASYKPNESLPVKPFALSSQCISEPSEFEVTFILNESVFQFGFSATKVKVVEEWLYETPLNRKRRSQRQLYVRSQSDKGDWNMNSRHLSGQKSAIAKKTRPNALFLSVAAQWNHELLTKLYDWFTSSLILYLADDEIMPVTKDHCLNSSNFKASVIQMLNHVDLGIENMSISLREVDNSEMVKYFVEDYREKFMTFYRGQEGYTVNFQHRNRITDEIGDISLEDESDGTKRYFDLIGPWSMALNDGNCLLIDELDRSLHPHLIRHLLFTFNSHYANPTGAQLLFSTHDTTLLNSELLRRDQIWFTEKGSEGSTSFFSLADFKGVRKEESFQKGYLAGRYGALPIIESFELTEKKD